MELILKNPIKTDKSTISELWLGLNMICYILEDEDKLSKGEPKEFGTTCIPGGRYQIKITRSTRFSNYFTQKMGHPVDIYLPEILNIDGFSGVRIHTLNKPIETEGCLGPGMQHGTDEIYNSSDAMKIVMNLLTTSREDNFITIIR